MRHEHHQHSACHPHCLPALLAFLHPLQHANGTLDLQRPALPFRSSPYVSCDSPGSSSRPTRSAWMYLPSCTDYIICTVLLGQNVTATSYEDIVQSGPFAPVDVFYFRNESRTVVAGNRFLKKPHCGLHGNNAAPREKALLIAPLASFQHVGAKGKDGTFPTLASHRSRTQIFLEFRVSRRGEL